MPTQPARPPSIFLLTVLADNANLRTDVVRWIKATPAASDMTILTHQEAEDQPGGPCLCCNSGTDISRRLEQMLRDLDNHRIAPFTGLIVPVDDPNMVLRVLATVMQHPYLSLRFAPARSLIAFSAEATAAHRAHLAGYADCHLDWGAASKPDPDSLLHALRSPDHSRPAALRHALYAAAMGSARPR